MMADITGKNFPVGCVILFSLSVYSLMFFFEHVKKYIIKGNVTNLKDVLKMTMDIKKIIDIQKIKLFFLSFALSVATIIGCRMLTTEMLNFSRDLGYVVSFSLLFALLTVLWSNKKHLWLCVVFIGIYLLSSVVK